MKSPYSPLSSPPLASCRTAGWLLFGAIGFCLLLTVAMAAHLWQRPMDPHRQAMGWMERFSLSTPALWPAGTPKRHPESIHPAVDLRFTPIGEAGP